MRNAVRIIAPALGLSLFAMAGMAEAECRLTLQPAQAEWSIPHDPFEEAMVERDFDVIAINQGDTPCSGRIAFDLKGEAYGLSLDGGGRDRVAYALVDERSSSDVTPRAGVTARRLNSRSVNVAPGERELLRFSFVARSDELLSAGDYSQTVFLSVDDMDGLPIAERSIVLNIAVPAVAVMGLKGEFQRSKGVATINLGELTQGPRDLNTSLYVLSTGGYSIAISSANSGRLRQASSEWSVDYGLSLGRTAVNLAQGDRIEKPSRFWQADDYPLTLTVGDVSARRAGDYTDTITFTVAAI